MPTTSFRREQLLVLQRNLRTLPNLAFFDRRSENIAVRAVVVAELEFGDVKRKIFFADFVECTDDATLHQRPEPLNGLGMDSTKQRHA